MGELYAVAEKMEKKLRFITKKNFRYYFIQLWFIESEDPFYA